MNYESPIVPAENPRSRAIGFLEFHLKVHHGNRIPLTVGISWVQNLPSVPQKQLRVASVVDTANGRHNQKAVQKPALIQLRAGNNLVIHLPQTFDFYDNDQCGCGAQKTVVHVLVDCRG